MRCKMGERLDINTLMRILDDNPLKAIEYMNSFVPEYLYKYSPYWVNTILIMKKKIIKN